MIPIAFQIVALVGVAAYLCHRRVGLRQRQTQSWELLVARLHPGWSDHLLTDASLSRERSIFAPREKWQQLRGARGLWSMFENAGVLLEMADFAVRHGDTFDGELLAEMRRDAMAIRVSVLAAFVRVAFCSVNQGICMSVLRAESAYAEMELCMTEVLQVNAAQVVPSFVAAM